MGGLSVSYLSRCPESALWYDRVNHCVVHGHGYLVTLIGEGDGLEACYFLSERLVKFSRDLAIFHFKLCSGVSEIGPAPVGCGKGPEQSASLILNGSKLSSV